MRRVITHWLARFLRTNAIDIIGVVLIVGAFGCGTWIRNCDWVKPVQLYEKNVRAYPDKARPRLGLAQQYLKRNAPGDFDRAVQQVWLAGQIRPALLELFKDVEDVDWEVVKKMGSEQDWNR